MSTTVTRRVAGAFASILLLFCMVAIAPSPAAANNGTSKVLIDVTYGQTEARSMLDMINNFRQGDDAWAWNEGDTERVKYEGLQPLAYDYDLEQIAMQRAAEIALRFSHERPDGSMCSSLWINEYCLNGENIAAGQTSAEMVFDFWLETDKNYDGQGHRRNMLERDYSAVGIGHVVANGIHYWVQEFSADRYSEESTGDIDGQKTVAVNVNQAKVESAEIHEDQISDIVLPGAGNCELPDVPATLRMKNAWPSRDSSVRVVVNDWSVADEGIARIEGNSIVAVYVGQTTLKGTASFGDKTVELNVPVKVEAEAITGATVTLGVAQFEFDGSAKEPEVTVELDGQELLSDTDYDLSFENNVNAGTAKVKVVGKGAYCGTVESTFEIAAKSLPENAIALSASEFVFSGSVQKPGVTVFSGDTRLSEGNDYSLINDGGTNAGTYNVTVTGKGNYKDSREASFSITPLDIADASVEVEAIPEQPVDSEADVPKPVVSVSHEGEKLTEGADADYSATYSRDADAGKGTVTIAGVGNFKENRKCSFDIYPRELYNARQALREKIEAIEAVDTSKYSAADATAIRQALDDAKAALAKGHAAVADDLESYLGALNSAQQTAEDNFEAENGSSGSSAGAGTGGSGNANTGSSTNAGVNTNTNTASNSNSNTNAGASSKFASANLTANAGVSAKTNTTFAKKTKKTNTLSAKTKSKWLTVKFSKLKKKSQSFSKAKAFKVTKAKGKVSFKVVKYDKKAKKKITVSKSGKVTVKKGLKKGKYTVKVKVTAAGNAQYKAGSKTVTLKVRVK